MGHARASRSGWWFALLAACGTQGFGCDSRKGASPSDASAAGDTALGDGAVEGVGGGGDRCNPLVLGCQSAIQDGVVLSLHCNEMVSASVLGQAVCVSALGCDSNECVTGVRSCFADCTEDGATGSGDDGSADAGGGETDAASRRTSDGATALGEPCGSDADCSGGLTCLKPTDNLDPSEPGVRFGPPNGLCTIKCTPANDPCPALGGGCILWASPPEAGSTADPNALGYCFELCTTGKTVASAAKCHNRDDFACTALPIGDVCLPWCTSDADCDTRKCDPGNGVCVDTAVPLTGAQLGSPCTTSPSDILDLKSQCAGQFCLQFDLTAPAGPGFCAQYCRSDSLKACGYRDTPIAAGPGRVGGCVSLNKYLNGAGDLGICFQMCDVPTDCALSSETCVLDPGVVSYFHHGYCYAAPDGGAMRPVDAGAATDGEAPPSTDGGRD